MKYRIARLAGFFFLSCLASAPGNINAQTKTAPKVSKPLFDKLITKDSLLFSAVFGTGDIKQVAGILGKDFLYFQDKGYGEGLSAQTLPEFMDGIRRMIERRTQGPSIRRELLKSSVEAYQQSTTEVVQTGVQHFYIVSAGQKDQQVEQSKFTRQWRLESGDWKLVREMDYLINTKFHNAPTGNDTLYAAIAHMDSVLFDAFNSRDLETIKKTFDKDLEFYHDKGGLTRYEKNMQNFSETFAGEKKVRRELVPGSLEIYPSPGYGAIQAGSHRFYVTEPGQTEKLSGTFKFVHVWKNENGVWTVTRIVSYDH